MRFAVTTSTRTPAVISMEVSLMMPHGNPAGHPPSFCDTPNGDSDKRLANAFAAILAPVSHQVINCCHVFL